MVIARLRGKAVASALGLGPRIPIDYMGIVKTLRKNTTESWDNKCVSDRLSKHIGSCGYLRLPKITHTLNIIP